MWKCSKCGCNNVSGNRSCALCYGRHGIITVAPLNAELEYDEYQEALTASRLARLDVAIGLYPAFINRVKEHMKEDEKERLRIERIAADKKFLDNAKAKAEELTAQVTTRKTTGMTPQEELFVEFFKNEKSEIKELDSLSLRARREGLAKIALEARARLYAVDEEERERKSKARKESGPTGFRTSLQPDDVSSEAINAVKKRQGKMSRNDKLKAGLAKLGISSADAADIVSNRTVLVKTKGEEAAKAAEPKVKPFTLGRKLGEPVTPVEPEKVVTEVHISEDTQTITIIKEEVQPTPEQPIKKNPFANTRKS